MMELYNNSCSKFSLSQPAGHILHNLSICCNCTDALKDDERSLLTFSVQLTRAVVTSVLLILLLLCYSTLRVLGRTIINCTATCVIPWIIFFGLYALKSLTVVIFIGIVLIKHYQNTHVDNQVGFITINCLQSIILMANCLALNHEWHYRSPDYVDNPATEADEGPWILKLRHLVCRNSTIFVCQAIVTLALLAAVEVLFEAHHGPPIWLVYVWLIAMLAQRVTVCVMGALVCIQHHNQPTVKAKIMLLLGLLFLIGDDLPNSLLATGDFCTKSVYDTDPCYLTVLGVYDILQMMGVIGTTLIFLFIRDQYVRVEEECKHHLLWDLERLLDVNTQERNDLLTK